MFSARFENSKWNSLRMVRMMMTLTLRGLSSSLVQARSSTPKPSIANLGSTERFLGSLPVGYGRAVIKGATLSRLQPWPAALHSCPASPCSPWAFWLPPLRRPCWAFPRLRRAKYLSILVEDKDVSIGLAKGQLRRLWVSLKAPNL